MTRRNISLPADLDAAARDAGLNVSALARAAIIAELDRRARMARLDAWLDELDAEHGPPSAAAMADAETWVSNALDDGVGAPGPGTAGSAARTRRRRSGARS